MSRWLTYLAFLTCLLASIPVFGQVGSNPATHQNVRIGGGPTDTELPFPGGTDLDDAGNVISSGEHAVGASTTTKAMLLLPHGVAPTSPIDGNLWTTSAGGLFVQINTVTVGPLIGVAAFDTEAKLEAILTDVDNIWTDKDAAYTSDELTVTILDATPTTISLGGLATTITIGAPTGTTTVDNNLVVGDDLTVGDGTAADITITFDEDTTDGTLVWDVSDDTFVFDNTIEINTGGNAIFQSQDGNLKLRSNHPTGVGFIDTDIITVQADQTHTYRWGRISDSGTAASLFQWIKGDGTSTITAQITMKTGDLQLDGDLDVDGGDFNTTAAAFSLLDLTPTTINFGGAATTITIGAATVTTTIDNDLSVSDELTVVGTGASSIAGALAVNGAAITTDDTTFGLLDTTAATINFGGEATAMTIGAATGTTTVDNDLTVSDELLVSGASKSFITGPLDVTGLFVAVVAKVATYTATTVDHVILCDATAGAFDIDLPAASGNSGLMFHIKKTDVSGNAVTIDPDGAETIDGAADLDVSTQFESFMIVCDGTEWHVI